SNHTFWHKDWLGSVRLASLVSNRNVVVDRAFAPFGETYKGVIGGNSTNQISFTGDTQDTIVGLFDTPNRELHPNQGRWISPDPAGLRAVNPTNPQSWNRYTYVRNDPNVSVDPLGLCDLISGGITQSPGTPQTQAEEAVADELGASLAFPFSGQGVFGSLASGAFGTSDQQVLANAIID